MKSASPGALMSSLPSIPVLAMDNVYFNAAQSRNGSNETLQEVIPSDSRSLQPNFFHSGEWRDEHSRVCHSEITSNGMTESVITTKASPFRTEPCHGGDGCHCPICQLNQYICFLFSNQRRSSQHVMSAWPSPCHLQTGGKPPNLPLIVSPNLSSCPVYSAFGFCPYSEACYLKHLKENCAQPLVSKLGSAEEEFERLLNLAQQHMSEDVWQCPVCAHSSIDEDCLSPVGEMYYYRQCPHCSFFCYFPYITYLVEHILDSVSDDYQQYKDLVDSYRRRLPDEFKVPLAFEAHRVANVIFSWSLLSPEQARDAMETVYKLLPEMEAVVSIGSGVGYIEHIFNCVMNAGVKSLCGTKVGPQRVLKSSRFMTSSFDGIRTSFYGKKIIPIYAFDEFVLHGTYSVHVSLGGPLSVLSMNCQQSVLLLCWPPFGSAQDEQSSMAFEALNYFMQGNGSVIIYIGDISSTGDWRFHQLLYTHYKLAYDYPVRREVRRWYPQEMGLVYAGNDTIGVYHRRKVQVNLPPHWNYAI